MILPTIPRPGGQELGLDLGACSTKGSFVPVFTTTQPSYSLSE